jgi:hypothetical protein
MTLNFSLLPRLRQGRQRFSNSWASFSLVLALLRQIDSGGANGLV